MQKEESLKRLRLHVVDRAALQDADVELAERLAALPSKWVTRLEDAIILVIWPQSPTSLTRSANRGQIRARRWQRWLTSSSTTECS